MLPGNLTQRAQGAAPCDKLETIATTAICFSLPRSSNIDVILLTELTRWGRSMLDLFHTLQDLQAWAFRSLLKPACNSICVVRKAN